MHLIELLLQAEKKARCTTPVNCYRKYLGQLLLDLPMFTVWLSEYPVMDFLFQNVFQLNNYLFTLSLPDLSLLLSDLPDSITVFVVFLSFIFFLSNRVIFSYRKPRMGFWLVQKLVTLNNREGAVAVIICTKSPNSVALAANCIKVVEVRLVMSPT